LYFFFGGSASAGLMYGFTPAIVPRPRRKETPGDGPHRPHARRLVTLPG
jgi:hypothetical protein